MIKKRTNMSRKEITSNPLCEVYKKSKKKLNCKEINTIVLDFLES